MDDITLLVEKSRNGDRDAFARIVEKYQGMVSAAALNIVGDYAQSEDLAQETFLTAWNKLPELREPEKSASWLYGIARRIALHWRDRQRNNPLQGAAQLDEQIVTDCQVQAESALRQQREESLRLVWSAVRELPETFREPLLLYYRYSRSVADIAESMQLTEEAVRQRLSRGRKMLKAEVEKQIESVLESTRPEAAFTLAVMSSIPGTVAVTALLTVTPALAAESSGGSVSAVVGSGSAWGIVGGLLGIFTLPFIFLASFLFGIWNCIRNAPTVRTRRFMIYASLTWYMIVWFSLGFLIMIAPGLHVIIRQFPHQEILYQGMCILILFTPILFLGSACYRFRRILAEDWDFSPKSFRPLEESFLSQRNLNRSFRAIAAGIPIMIAIVAFVGFRNWTRLTSELIDIGFGLALILAGHFAFLWLMSRGIRISRNEEVLRQTPPRNGTWIDSFRNEISECGLGTRKALVADIVLMFLLASPYTLAILIPSSWMPATGAPVQVGLDGILTATLVPELIALWFVTQFAGRPGRRLQGYSGLCMSMGVFIPAVVLLLRFPVQSMRISFLWDKPREYFWPYLMGLISELPFLLVALGFYFGLACLCSVGRKIMSRIGIQNR